MNALPTPPLLVISNRQLVRRPLSEVAAEVFEAGARWFMLREKDLPRPQAVALARACQTIAEAYDAVLTLNVPHVLDVARAAGVSSVHVQTPQAVVKARAILGQRALVGMSAHTTADVEAAAMAGADYVTWSPVFASVSKVGYVPEGDGVAQLQAVAYRAPISVVALGGITPSNAMTALQAGATGVAVLGFVMQAAAPGKAVMQLLAACGWQTSAGAW
nr:thiamine phosphate synthase [Ardenticatena sp.]